MYKKSVLVLILIMFAAQLAHAGKSEYLKQFKVDYKALDAEILKYISERVDVTDFVYQKDFATFTFKSGSFYLLRHVQGRPTAAIFIGEGNCQIDPVIPNERRTLGWCSGKETVDEDFESCFIRFGDDLDLALAAYPTQEHKIAWREFNTYKRAQAEFYFRPVTFHEYDNYFQLLRSVYDRKVDGYFWIDFNDYVFKYDPSLAEPTVIAYELEGGQLTINEVVSLKRSGDTDQTNYSMSNQTYPTTLVSRSGLLRLSGMTGQNIDEAAINLQIQVNRDSTKFVSLFLHYNLEIDSILYRGQQCDYWRRRDFTFVGLILPEYRLAGEILDLTIFYHGKNYTIGFPFVKNPFPSETNIDLYGSIDFDYFFPGKSDVQKAEGRFNKFLIAPEDSYRHLYLQPVSNGFDTLTKLTSSGSEVKFLKSDRYAKSQAAFFTPDKKYEEAIMQALDYMSPRLGERPTADPLFIYPDSILSIPGLIELKQLVDYDDQTGALASQAGLQVARQWFGPLMKPATDRELWCTNAFPDYLGLRFALEAVGGKKFFSQLLLRQHTIERAADRHKNMPPGAGDRASVEIRTAKGSWIVHMLRYLMYDPKRPAEVDFLKFVREFAQKSNQATFTNQDLVEIAESYYGEELDGFFDTWLFGNEIPRYDVKFETIEQDGEFYVTVDLDVSRVSEAYAMPVWFRVVVLDENEYFHESTVAGEQTLELGPFLAEPTDLIFNEFLSVLCKSHVSKK